MEERRRERTCASHGKLPGGGIDPVLAVERVAPLRENWNQRVEAGKSDE